MTQTFTYGTRELRENLQPAQCFIEVFRIVDQSFKAGIYQSHQPLPIRILDGCCKENSTIAVFKIREKKPANE